MGRTQADRVTARRIISTWSRSVSWCLARGRGNEDWRRSTDYAALQRIFLTVCVTVCGRELRRPTGMIQSPNYPNAYPNYANCEWAIILPARRQILLSVTDFHLEPGQNCSNDYLEIRYVALYSISYV